MPNGITGYSAYADGMDSRKFFTMRFADCKNGVRIIPYTGNTIIKSYTAIFRFPKNKKYSHEQAKKKTEKNVSG